MNQTNQASHRATAVQPPSLAGGRIAFIQSSWHKDIVDQCRIAFMSELGRLGLGETPVDAFQVPGAFEIPLQAKLLSRTGKYVAIVAAGFVVDGGIYRHEFVADAVISALMRVQLDTEVPVISAVLTPQRFHEHQEHARFFRECRSSSGLRRHHRERRRSEATGGLALSPVIPAKPSRTGRDGGEPGSSAGRAWQIPDSLGQGLSFRVMLEACLTA